MDNNTKFIQLADDVLLTEEGYFYIQKPKSTDMVKLANPQYTESAFNYCVTVLYKYLIKNELDICNGDKITLTNRECVPFIINRNGSIGCIDNSGNLVPLQNEEWRLLKDTYEFIIDNTNEEEPIEEKESEDDNLKCCECEATYEITPSQIHHAKVEIAEIIGNAFGNDSSYSTTTRAIENINRILNSLAK